MNSNDITKYIVTDDQTVLDIMEVINTNAKGIAFVCDENNKLQGVITDGNIRRHILNKGSLYARAYDIANKEYKFIMRGDNVDPFEFMKENAIKSVPIIDSDRQLISIRFFDGDEAIEKVELNIPVVIMAGGKGTRLQPYTNILPKPLIPIGEKTITELIMDNFSKFGCNQFDMIVNYKKNLIKAFFAEQDKYNVDFIDEEEFLGTGGGLKLIEGKYSSTIFMTNCDIIVNENYSDMLKFHKSKNAVVTMVCAVQNYKVPYGTIELDERGNAVKLKEKPEFPMVINTGIYIMEPEFIREIPDNTFIHITDVIERCIDKGMTVAVYPISANAWMDMGQMEELGKMRQKLDVQM